MTDWQDLIVGDRMAVDREFSGRVADSEFSSQEWGLVMTATEFRVRDASDPDSARLVADTSKVEQIVPELENIQQNMGPMGPGGGGGGSSGSSSGIIGSVKDALGMSDNGSGGSDTEDVVRRAERLTGEYADLLQERLENEGKWERVRALAAGETPPDATGSEPAAADDEPDPDGDSDPDAAGDPTE